MADNYNTRQTLIDSVRDQNNDHAWEDFVATYEPYIYAIIRRMGISPADSRDIHQDVLVQIWKHLPEYKCQPDSRFRGWVSTITTNAVRSFIRSRSNKSKKLNTFEREQKVLEAGLSEIDAIAEKEWEVFLAETALENIKSSFSGRGIDVFLKTLDGQSVEQIAADLNIEETSVYQLRARVKKSLSKEVGRLRAELD